MSIAELLRGRRGFAIGVVSTVPFSHATPAAHVSHNTYIQVSSETGIPGLLLYMAALALAFLDVLGWEVAFVKAVNIPAPARVPPMLDAAAVIASLRRRRARLALRLPPAAGVHVPGARRRDGAGHQPGDALPAQYAA